MMSIVWHHLTCTESMLFNKHVQGGIEVFGLAKRKKKIKSGENVILRLLVSIKVLELLSCSAHLCTTNKTLVASTKLLLTVLTIDI